MSRQIILAILLLLATVSRGADATGYQWQRATALYDQKEYDSSASYFEQIAKLKPANAVVYYNLGNAYYRANRVAPAILNYERALKADPDYKDAKDNLALAQNRIPNHLVESGDIFFVRWWRGMTGPNRATMWAVLALIFFLAVMGIAVARKYGKKGSRIPIQVPGVIGFIFCCFLFLAFISATNAYEHNTAVVMENDVPLMGRAQRGKAVGMVPEGTTVHVLGESAGWVEVSLPDGRTGWLEQGDITAI
jgi:tetratricopeptide (TPR) repeat protein